MMRFNDKLTGELMGRGAFSLMKAAFMPGKIGRAAKKFAGRVGLSGELLMYDAPKSGANSAGPSERNAGNGRRVNLSLTDIEAAHNEARVCDILGCSDSSSPERAVALFFACARELTKKFGGTPFELVLYIDGESAGTLRLYRVRVNDPSWLSENIDSYSEPVAVYRNRA